MKKGHTVNNDNLFFEDKAGKQDPTSYPTKFAKQKFPKPINKTQKNQINKLKHTQQPKAQEQAVYDLWEQEQEVPLREKPNQHIPAVIPPHPGQSYKPDSPSHKSLLEKVIDEEAKSEHQTHVYNMTVNNYKVVEEDPEPPDLEDPGETNFIQNPPVKAKFLTNSEKNQKKRKVLKKKLEEEIKAKQEALQKIDQIRSIMKNLEKEEISQEIKKLQKELKKTETKELEAKGEKAPKIRNGKFCYKLPATTANLEVPGSLRQLTVKGNSAEERLDSLIRRRLIDVEEPEPKKQIKVKEYTPGGQEKKMHDSRAKKQNELETGVISLSN